MVELSGNRIATVSTPQRHAGRRPAIRRSALSEAVRGALLGAIGLGASVNASAQLFPATLDLSSLDGTIGFTLDGEASGDSVGSVSRAGDVNGDGIDDLVIGARGADPNGISSGRTYVVFGRDSSVEGSFPTNFQLSSLDGTNGFELDGEAAYDTSGRPVSAAGDLNGDGIDDIVIGAREADSNANRSGSAYVVFGRNVAVDGAFPPNLQLSSLDGANGFRLDGTSAIDIAGIAVSGAGDVNNDGIGDLIVGAAGADPNGTESGQSYVVYGKETAVAGNFPSVFQLSSLDGTEGFIINGESAGDYAGSAADYAGDVDGDGIDDLVIGAFRANANGSLSGRSYVVFGRDPGTDGPFPSPLELSSLNGSDGFELRGEAASDFSGVAVSAVGDFNGDGIADLAIGAFRSSASGSSAGRSYVVFGRDVGAQGPFPAVFELSALDGSDGVKLDGRPGDQAGGSLDAAGDVNNDGVSDLIIGAENASVSGGYDGRSYIVFGRDVAAGDPFPATLALSALSGADGLALNGESNTYAGSSVTGAGDLNGDGVDDLAVTASEANPNGSGSGRTYVVFGRSLDSDLSVRMRDCNDPAKPGGEIDFGFMVQNAGPDDASDVVLESTLPAGLALVSARPGGLCSDAAGEVTCDIGSLPVGSSFELGWTVSVGVGLSGPVTTSVAVTTLNQDPPSNNVASESTLVLDDLIFFDGTESCGS